jgi:hypothetical protein
MKRIVVLLAVFYVLSVQTAIAQDRLMQKLKTIDQTKKNQPAEQAQENPPVTKASQSSNATVIDVRNIAVSAPQPGADKQNIFSNKVASPSEPAATFSSLNASELKNILSDSGLQFTPSNLYMRLSPKQISVSGKGYLHPYKPYIVIPNFMIFDEFYTGTDSSCGIHLVLKEAGTYVLDFLIEFEDGYPVGTVYPCKVLKSMSSALQTVNVSKADGPQHILVVVNYDGSAWGSSVVATGANLNQLYGLRLEKPEGSYYEFRWKFYQVDVTKMP